MGKKSASRAHTGGQAREAYIHTTISKLPAPNLVVSRVRRSPNETYRLEMDWRAICGDRRLLSERQRGGVFESCKVLWITKYYTPYTGGRRTRTNNPVPRYVPMY